MQELDNNFNPIMILIDISNQQFNYQLIKDILIIILHIHLEN